MARLAETWFRRPPGPTRVVLDVTRRCNLRCAMCRTWEATPDRSALRLPELEALFDALPRLCWLDLTGGEPFVRRDFEAIATAALERLPALHVLHFQTNGWHTARIAQACRDLAAHRPEVDLVVTVSIDGPQEIHDAIRGREGSHRRAVATLRELVAAGIDVHAGTTVTARNATCFESVGAALARAVPGFSPRRWHWNFGQTSEHFFGNGAVAGVDPEPAMPRTQQQGALTRHLRRRGVPRDLTEVMESLYLVHSHAVRGGSGSGIPCQALRSTLFISPEGDVYPCHLWDRRLGNLRETSIDALWRSAQVRSARRDVEKLACGGCFSACEAYPALAGAPLTTLRRTVQRLPAALRDPTPEHAR